MTIFIDALIQIMTFTLVTASVLISIRGVESFLTVRRRLGAAPVPLGDPAPGVLKTDTVKSPFLLWVQSATSLSDIASRGRLRRELYLAGFDHPAAPIWYVIIRFGSAIGLPVLFILSQSMKGGAASGFSAFVAPIVLCGLGLIGPKLYINNRASDRRTALEHQFPDALDLMVVCVEAGLGLEATFVRVASEVRHSHPRIAEEFNRLADELSAGRGRTEALRALAERVDVDSIKSFVALLIQSDSLGVSIAQGLRTYSVEMRETRYINAEEKAMRIPVLMTVPLVACLMPVIIVALLLPPAIDVIRTITPALGGQQASTR